MDFDAFHLVPDLLTQPLQVIVEGRHGKTGSYEDSEHLFDAASNPDKDFFVVERAGHYDMYHVAVYVDQAIGRLVPFYSRLLGNASAT